MSPDDEPTPGTYWWCSVTGRSPREVVGEPMRVDVVPGDRLLWHWPSGQQHTRLHAVDWTRMGRTPDEARENAARIANRSEVRA